MVEFKFSFVAGWTFPLLKFGVIEVAEAACIELVPFGISTRVVSRAAVQVCSTSGFVEVWCVSS